MHTRIDVESRRPLAPQEMAAYKGNCWKFLMIILVGIIGLLVGELGTLTWALRRCRFPFAITGDTGLVVAVSDVHVLGTNKNSLDIAWTTWQLKKSFWMIITILQPSAIFILGDHLDQGGHASDDEWTSYVRRYRWATDVLSPDTKPMTVIDSVIGNHDAQFAHLGLTGEMIKRFKGEFGEVNGIQRLQHNTDIEVVWVNALALYDQSSSEAHVDTMEFLKTLAAVPKNESVFRILLSHVPTYRLNDMDCGNSRLRESSHVTYVGPDVALNPLNDVLDKSTSRKLIDSVRPDVMLSGHLHSQCYRQNAYQVNLPIPANLSFLDISVPSLSYRMRPDPGFTLLAIGKSNRAFGKTCKLPTERVLIGLDVVSVILIIFGVGGTLNEIRKATAHATLKVE